MSYTLNVTQLKKASVLLVYIHVVLLPGPRYMQGNEMKVHCNLEFNSHASLAPRPFTTNVFSYERPGCETSVGQTHSKLASLILAFFKHPVQHPSNRYVTKQVEHMSYYSHEH